MERGLLETWELCSTGLGWVFFPASQGQWDVYLSFKEGRGGGSETACPD